MDVSLSRVRAISGLCFSLLISLAMFFPSQARATGSDQKGSLAEQLEQARAALQKEKEQSRRMAEDYQNRMSRLEKNLNKQIVKLEKDNDELVKQNKQLDNTVAAFVKSFKQGPCVVSDEALSTIILTPKGKVTAVKDRYVEISVGRDDGMRVGHQCDIFRGDKFIGRIEIRRISPDRSVGVIAKTLQDTPKAGDTIETKHGKKEEKDVKLAKQFARLQRDNRSLIIKIAEIRVKMEKEQQTLQQVFAELQPEKLKVEAQLKKVLEKIQQWEKELHQHGAILQQLNADLIKRFKQHGNEIADLKNDIKKEGTKTDDKDDVSPKGKITAVQGKYAEISIGSDDGVKVGQKYDVFRGNSFIGRYEVVRVRPDRSVVEAGPRLGPMGNPTVGDTVELKEEPEMTEHEKGEQE